MEMVWNGLGTIHNNLSTFPRYVTLTVHLYIVDVERLFFVLDLQLVSSPIRGWEVVIYSYIVKLYNRHTYFLHIHNLVHNYILKMYCFMSLTILDQMVHYQCLDMSVCLSMHLPVWLKIWNSLPTDIQNCVTLKEFKSWLKLGMALNTAVYCVIECQDNLEYLKCIYFIFVIMHIISWYIIKLIIYIIVLHLTIGVKDSILII